MNALALSAGWLLTFAAHSTLLLGTALLLCGLLRRRAIGWQEALCRFALLGGLCSSTVQWFVLGGPIGIAPAMSRALPHAPAPLRTGGLAEPIGIEEPSAALGDDVAAWSSDAILCAVAGALAVLGVVWLLRAHLGLRGLLADREPETDARVLATAGAAARDLGLRTAPRLSRSSELRTPVAFGFLQPEVCLPARSAELADGGLRAMLTHELAHLRRRDPAWLLCGAMLQALFPWQLLLFVVRRRLHQLGELRCDAEAARATSPVAVASCLLAVAEWLRPGAALPRGALAMAARPSALRERVEMALAGGVPGRVQRGAGMALGLAFLAGLTAAAPGTRAAPAVAMLPAGEPSGPAVAKNEPPLAGLPAELVAEYRLLLEEAAALGADSAGDDAELAQLRGALGARVAHLTRIMERLAAVLQRERSNHDR